MLTADLQDSSWNIYSVSFEADCMNGNEPGTTSPVRPSGERGASLIHFLVEFFDDFLTNYTHLALTCSSSPIIL